MEKKQVTVRSVSCLTVAWYWKNGQHPAVAGAEERRHARRLHARQRPAAQTAAHQPIERPGRDLEHRRGQRAAESRRRCRSASPRERALDHRLQRSGVRAIQPGGLAIE